MKNNLRVLIGSALATLLLPGLALAAADDVTLTTDTVLSAAGVTLNVSGSSATIETITVNSDNFSFTLQNGSSLQVTAPNLNQLSASTAIMKTTDTCNSSSSILKYEGTGEKTVTITPLAALCSSTGSGGSQASESSSSSSSSSSGGGGGSSSTATTATTATTVTTATTATTPATQTTTTSTTGAQAQLNALLAQLTTLQQQAGGSFTQNLDVGAAGEDVRALQRFLNTTGFSVNTAGPGSPGNETATFGGLTRAALARYQAARGISPAVGYFGPATRARITSEQIGGVASSPTMPSSTGSFTMDMETGSTGSEVQALQQYLNTHGYMIAESGPGSPGSETMRFGTLTRTALIKLQEANGISPAAGYFGPKTRAFVEANP